MELTKTQKIIIGIIFVAVLFGMYLFFIRKSKNNIEISEINFNQSSTTGKLSNGLEYKIEKVNNGSAYQIPKPIPDLDRAIIKSPLATNVTESDFLSASKKVKEFQVVLKNNPSNFSAWLDMAMYQKMGGDYDGAIISWEYAGKLIPSDYISIANIGNLYAYYIKDNAKSISYYEAAIKRAPTQTYLYTQLAGVYFDIMKDKVSAKSVIERGLKNIPNDPTLLEWRNELDK